MLIDSLPLTSNGKIDQQALLALGELEAQSEKAFVPPQTPIEQVLAGIWADVLGIKQVSTADSFFDLGGHSLLATRVVTLIREIFPINLPLRNIFEFTTVRELAEHMNRSADAMGVDILTMSRVLIDIAQLTDEEVEARLSE